MELPKRKNIRLKDYGYSQNGAYFVIICTQNRECYLGEIVVGEGFPLPNVRLNESGKIINEHIGRISTKYISAKIDKYIIMPNHIHMIIVLKNNETHVNGAENPGTGNPSPTIGNIIGWYKYQTTREFNIISGTVGLKLWQRSYHDHIIRNEQEYQKIWEYIDTNPQKWKEDCYHAK